MRNIFTVACLALLLSLSFVTEVFAAATLVTGQTEKSILPNITRYVYVVADTVETGTPEVFKIPTLKAAGTINAASFDSTSPDVRVHLNGLDGESFTDQPVFDWEIDTLSYSPEMKDRPYVNMDTTQIKFQYFTIINNSATPTGTWTLTLDFIR